jgi:hypothetical protein
MSTAQVLPKELRLSAPPTMPQARSYLFKQQSVNSSYEPGASGTIQINLPRLQRSYLTKDSYLKFRIALSWDNNGATDPNAPCFDLPGAFGLFDRIEVYDYLGSTLLESTSGQGQLMALLMDTQTSTDELGFHYGTTSGTKGGRVIADAEVTAGVVQYNLVGPSSGGVFTTTTNDGTETHYYEYTIPLFSFLGLLSQKFAPLHNGYTIQLTLNTAAQALGFATTAGGLGTGTAPSTYVMSNIYLCCQVLELGPIAESMLIASTQGQPFVVPSKAYRNYIGNIPAASSAYRLDMNLNVASLTNILWMMRENTYLNNILYKCLSYRIRNYLSSWNFQYGSTILPQTSGIQAFGPPGSIIDEYKGGFNEAYCELMKARHNLNAPNFNSIISKHNFWVDTAAEAAGIFGQTAATNLALTADNILETGKFAAGLDLELVSGRSNDLVCGMNTNGMNTSINLTFDPTNSTDVVSARLDLWAEYDSFVNISPGIATTVSF